MRLIKVSKAEVVILIFIALQLFAVNVFSAACEKGLSKCNWAADTNRSICLVRASYPPYPVTTAYCYSQYSAETASCSSGYNNCDETYIAPEPELISILYMPPGDQSTISFSSSSESETTRSWSSSYSDGSSLGFGVNISGISLGTQITVKTTTSNSRSITYGVRNVSGTTWATLGNAIDHAGDVLKIWLNPLITEGVYPLTASVPLFGNGNVNVSDLGNVEYNPLANSGKGSIILNKGIGENSSAFISVRVSELLNPTSLLPSQLRSRTFGNGDIGPGLLSLCENRIPEAQCSSTMAQSNACGCTAEDFAFIIEQHPFFDPNISDQSVAAINAIDPNNARLVPIKSQSGGDLIIPIDGGVAYTYSITDTYNAKQSYSQSIQRSGTAKIGFGIGDLGINGNISWDNSASSGRSQSTNEAHTQSVRMATSSNNCYDNILVYQDTLYHTFVFVSSSSAPDPCL